MAERAKVQTSVHCAITPIRIELSHIKGAAQSRSLKASPLLSRHFWKHDPTIDINELKHRSTYYGNPERRSHSPLEAMLGIEPAGKAV